MSTGLMHVPLRLMSFVVLTLTIASPAGARDKKQAGGPPVIRWQQGDPECTLSTGADGIYRYSLSYETLVATLAVDSQEVEKNRRTLEHVFRILLTVRNRGTNPVYVQPQAMTLELVDHFHLRMRAEDPDELAAQIQNDSEELVHQSEKELKKHPDRKPVVEARLREHQKVVAEWQEYLTARTLRNVALDHAQPEATGLVFFPTRSKWKGDWKPQEHFIARLPIANIILEFPFPLPPPGDPQLRERPGEPTK
jgi:hypothetical protein